MVLVDLIVFLCTDANDTKKISQDGFFFETKSGWLLRWLGLSRIIDQHDERYPAYLSNYFYTKKEILFI